MNVYGVVAIVLTSEGPVLSPRLPNEDENTKTLSAREGLDEPTTMQLASALATLSREIDMMLVSEMCAGKVLKKQMEVMNKSRIIKPR